MTRAPTGHQSGPQGETAYIGPYFTVRNATIGTKHVYAGSGKLASKLVRQSADRFGPYSPTIGLNLYQYGLLNPLIYIDPNGRSEALTGILYGFNPKG